MLYWGRGGSDNARFCEIPYKIKNSENMQKKKKRDLKLKKSKKKSLEQTMNLTAQQIPKI